MPPSTCARRRADQRDHNLLPHLAHRDQIYDFPVPWRNVNWGVDGEHLADPAGVHWIVVDRREMSTEDLALLERLLERQFRTVSTATTSWWRSACTRRPTERVSGRLSRAVAGRLDQAEVAVVAAVERRGAAGLAVGEQVEVVPEQLELERPRPDPWAWR